MDESRPSIASGAKLRKPAARHLKAYSSMIAVCSSRHKWWTPIWLSDCVARRRYVVAIGRALFLPRRTPQPPLEITRLSKDFWHGFWANKLAMMGRRGVVVYSRTLVYRNKTLQVPGFGNHSFLSGEEKGIDVALIFSQD